MPTFKITVGTQKSGDKTYPIYIRLTQKSKIKYLPTGHYVLKSQLNNKGQLKDVTLIDELNADIKEYREKLQKLPNLINTPVEALKTFLLADDGPVLIDFIAFGREFINTQSKSTGKNTETALNSLITFLGMDRLNISNLNLVLLNKYASWLKSEREVSDTGVRDYVGKLRQIFLAARLKYNDEDNGRILIPHYPFAKFKMPSPAKTKKRNIKVDVIKMIRDCPDVAVGKYSRKGRSGLARDVFMLSFYLVGMNMVDIYKIDEYKNGRLSYRRSKTESRKGEGARVSIKVEPEVLPFLEKYKDFTGKRVFNFYHLYADPDYLTKAVNTGLKAIIKSLQEQYQQLELPNITTYYARHSWATIARNICKVSKDDIGYALNHSDGSHKTTDIYIEEDYSIIDEANRKVLDTLL